MMGSRGRPTKLNALVAKRICAAVRRGNTRKDAAECAGVDVRTFQEWLARGRTGKPEDESFRILFRAVKRAESQFVDDNIKVIQRAKKKSWQASAWLLERRRPNDFAQRAKLDHSGGTKSELTLRVQQSDDFYGNSSRITTETSRPSIAGPIESGAVQIIDVRETVGEDIGRTNGKHRGARTGTEDVQGGGNGRQDLVGGSELPDDS